MEKESQNTSECSTKNIKESGMFKENRTKVLRFRIYLSLLKVLYKSVQRKIYDSQSTSRFFMYAWHKYYVIYHVIN